MDAGRGRHRTDGEPRGRGILRDVIAQTCALVAPDLCPCGRDGAWLCERCAALLRREPLRVESCCDALQLLTAARVREERKDGVVLPAGVDHRALLPVLALGEYGGALQALVLAWKNGGMLHLGGRMAEALLPAVALLAADAATDAAAVTTAAATTDSGADANVGSAAVADPAAAEAAGPAAPALVPVPSRRSARLRRGEDHTAELVRALERRGAGRALLLGARPTTAQEGQGARQRRTRRIELSGRRAREAGRAARDVVIVDDVVTTGATLRGMHEALTGAGMRVLGAVVVASARVPPSASRKDGALRP